MAALVAVARQPQQTAPPILTEVGPFTTPSDITLTENLNAPDELTFTVPARTQEPSIAARFLDLAAQATEVHWYDDTGSVIFAGPLVGYSPTLQGDDIAWQIRAQGLLSYLSRWRIRPQDELIYTATDQALIAKGLVDYWQALNYGDYGIDTSGITTTGVTRDRTYEAGEMHLIAQRIQELGAVWDGFDHSIDPNTRDLVIHYPEQGTDQTSAIQIDARNVVNPDAQLSIGPEDLISDAYAVGEDGLYSENVSIPLRQAFGRTAFGASFSGVTNQATLDRHAQRLQRQRDSQLHIPPSAIYPVTFAWEDFGIGDLVEFAYNYGAGLVVEDRRVGSRTLSITPEGIATIQVGVI